MILQIPIGLTSPPPIVPVVSFIRSLCAFPQVPLVLHEIQDFGSAYRYLSSTTSNTNTHRRISPTPRRREGERESILFERVLQQEMEWILFKGSHSTIQQAQSQCTGFPKPRERLILYCTTQTQNKVSTYLRDTIKNTSQIFVSLLFQGIGLEVFFFFEIENFSSSRVYSYSNISLKQRKYSTGSSSRSLVGIQEKIEKNC